MSDKILIVDDTTELLFFLDYIFKRSGFDVVTAANGKDAVRLAKETKPDVLLVDVMMPGIDGLEVCKQLRQDAEMHEVPILLYSAAVGEEIRQKALEAGANEFLGKTINHEELVTKVRNWLASES
ncbi:MAG: response regulator [Anaerolineales bacterium]|jgi:DNA-binding response OmpR family regulator